jgi:tripartite-type tricarboxylate transporter receptor subunit TctC
MGQTLPWRAILATAGLAELGSVPLLMTPAEFGKFIADEIKKWGKVIRAANIKAG